MSSLLHGIGKGINVFARQGKLSLILLLFSFSSISYAQDLIVSSVDDSGISTNSQTLEVSGNIQAGITNISSTDVSADFQITAFEDRDGDGLFGPADLDLGNTNFSGGLGGGANTTVIIPVNGAVTFAGNLIYIFVDSSNVIAENDETNNVSNSGLSSQFQPTLGPFSPNLEWSWTSSSVEPGALNVMMTPSVIDLNGDNIPEVVFGSTSDTGGGRVIPGFLRALDGRDGSELFTITDSDLRINTATSIATGDIDLDGLPEIIASDDSCTTLIAFENDGTFKWRSDTTDCTNWGAITIADIDQDGIPEVLHGRDVFDNNGSRIWSGTAGRGTQSNLGGMSLVADIDLDGENEVVAGQTVYNSTGGIEVTLNGVPDGYNAIGNFDTDDFAEIVHVRSGAVRLFEHDGTLIWGPVFIPGGGVGGPPTIADYDNDGEPEIGVAGARRYAVFETDGSLLWQVVTQDVSSNRTGSSVFDFEGDGIAEVVYRDERFLRVYRGTDGTVLFETDMSSCTWHEYVLVADVDADGNAEIVAVANNNCGFGPQRGVFVFGDQNDNWVATRQIWNQHTYHITNINSDGSIPAVEQNNWLIDGLNNYRLNEFLPDEGQSTNAPDLTSSFIRFDQSNCPASVEITARIGNGGSLFVPAGVNVSFYQGDPAAGGVLIGTTVSTLVLQPGQFEDISVTWNNPVIGVANIYVVADDDGTGNSAINEGDETNNSANVEETFCIPACIDDLQARAKRGKIQLTWTHVPSSEYGILRSDALNGVYTEIARTTSDYSTYLDGAINLGQTYYYQIQREPGNFGEDFCISDIIAAQAPTGRTRMTIVPNIVGLTEPVAGTSITDANLTSGTISTATSDTVPLGLVVSQDPPQNSALPQGSSVEYVISLGSVAPPNNIPFVDAGADSNIDEGDVFVANGSFSDPDTDTWTATVDYGDGSGAVPLFLTPANTFELNHSYADNGVFTITVSVSDGNDIGTDEAIVTVANVAPSLTVGTDRSVNLGDSVSLDSTSFTDPGMDDTHTASIDWGDGSAIEAGTVTETNGSGTVSGSHTYLGAGTFTVTVTVTDDDGGTDSDSFDVVVIAPNNVPSITSAPVTNAVEGSAYSYDVEATDIDGDTLSYALSTAPVGMTIDAVTGLIDWTPTTTQVGDNPVQVDVNDGRGGLTSQTFTIVVDVFVPPNQSPTISTAAVLVATEGEAYVYDVDASDPDGDVLTYSLVTAPTGMTIDSATGLINWAPENSQVGDNAVTVQVDDGNGGIASQSFTIAVASAPQNQIPVINTTPSLTATEDQPYSYDVDASDPDGDTLTYSLVAAPAGMSIDSVSGLINWTPSSSQLGDNSVDVQVDDGNGGIANQSFVIVVIPQPNQLPSINSTPTTTAISGQQYSYDVDAIDPDNDVLEYSFDTAPVGMTINPLTGLINWIPADTQAGTNPVVVRVDDGNDGSVTQSYSIDVTVVIVNQPPTITSAPVTAAEEGMVYNYDVNASDPNGDTLTFSLDTAPSGMTIDASSGLISWIPSNTQIGDNDVVIRVVDGNGGFATQSFSITVTAAPPVNQPPSITSTPVTSAVVGGSYQYDVTANDPDGDTLTFSLTVAPAGMSIDSASGLITWVPSAGQVGSQSVTVRASDGQAFVEQSFNISVTTELSPLDVNVSASPDIIDLNDTTTITVAPLGGVGTVEISLTVNGNPVILDSNGQAVITGDAVGGFELIATATDSQESVSTPGFFSVRDPGDVAPPVVSIVTPDIDAIVTEPVDIIGTATDANLVNYRLLLSPAGQGEFVEFARSTASVNNDVLGQFDPSLLVNGIYDVLLIAIDANGLESMTSTTYRVDGDLKVGNFSITLEDLNIPLAGIPIRVTRTYDSRRRNENLDFGYGWTVNYQDVKIEESRIPGRFWELVELRSGPFGLFVDFCVEPQGAPIITITLPNGDVESFEVGASPRCNNFTPILDVTLVFNPVGDTQSTLQALNDTSARLLNGNLVETGFFSNPVNPSRYLFTTRQGFEYFLDQGFGITQIVDPNGNTITYSDNGIVHSSGTSIDFIRDANGRITEIVDPAGNAIRYEYSSGGDLSRVVERDSATTNHIYNRSHGLLDIIDPLGRNIVRNIYDDDGRLIAQEDQMGNRTEFNHDLAGRQSIVTDRNGNTTLFFYDEEGNVINRVDALGNTSSFTYDINGNQLTQTNALGNTTAATYSSDNDQLTQTNALGNTVRFEYNNRGQETRIEDARGNVFNNTYDIANNLLTVTDPEGNLAGNNINAQGFVTRTVDVLGNATNFTYDGEGNKLTETDPEGSITTFTYDDNNNVLTETQTRTVGASTVNETMRFAYDSRNRVIRTTDQLGNITETEYDLAGQAVARIDALGRRTEMDYDAYGRLVETRYPDSSIDNKDYDPEGNLISETDRLGRITRFEYDTLDRLIRTVFPDGTDTRVEYDAIGRITAEIDERGNRTEHQYDTADRRILTRDALGNETQFEYDANGNLARQNDARGNATEFTYNSLDQKTAITFANGSVMRETFDALDRLVSKVDQAGVETQYEYDGLGRLTAVIDALNQRTEYTYDEVGNKLTQTDANGNETRWEYDALGRVTARILPLGQREVMTYDSVGNLISRTDFNGNTTIHEYDINDRLIRRVYEDGSEETYTYDAIGNRQSATDSSGTISYDYDNRDRITRETKPDGSFLEYQYDAAGNRTQTATTIQTNVGSETISETHTYDVLNRLASTTDTDGNTTTYDYDAVGNRTSLTYPNGNTTTYTYDELNRLTNLNITDGATTVLQSYIYTLHPTGRRLQIQENNGRTNAYEYDDLYRLTGETVTDASNGDYSAQYTYDAVGNRTFSVIDGVSTAYTYDDNDRLLQQGAEQYTYDANGNTLTKTIDSDVTTYTYDNRDKLIQIEATVASNTITSGYNYDVDGLRTAKIESGSTIQYITDNNRDFTQVLAEVTDGVIDVTYTYGDDLISQTRATNQSYYLYDGLGSTRSLANLSGDITDNYNYDAFGVELNRTGTTENSYFYAGEQFDQSLDQYYLRARYYNQGIGRFTQMDTWLGISSDPITLHKYLYANIDPVNMVDPSGNFSIGSAMTAVSVTASLVSAATTGYTIGQFLTGEKEFSAKSVGLLILLNAGGKYAKFLLPKKVRDCLFNSFPAETLIHTDSGAKSIEDIEIGQLVLSYNEVTGDKEYQPVTHLIQSEKEHVFISITLENGVFFNTTDEHPFYVGEAWVPAKNLKENDKVVLLDKVLKVVSVTAHSKVSKVYNLSVDKNHTFYVGEQGVLAHNQNIQCIPFKLKLKGKLPKNTPKFPAAPDWAVKGPHFTIATKKGPVELFFKVDATGKPIYTGVLGGSSSGAVKEAMKLADELFESNAFRAHVANKAYNGWEIAMQTSKGIKNPKTDLIFETVINLMRGL